MRRLAAAVSFALLAACAPPSDDPAGASDDLTGANDVFADRSVLPLTIEAPFEDLFAAAHAGEPNGPLPGVPRRTFDEAPGKITFHLASGAERTLDVTVKVRGNSSLVECPFPKLTVKLTDAAKDQAKDTPFAKNTKFKVGTHCADAGDGDRGTVGRLRNEKSPLREQLVLAQLEQLLPITLASRPARVVYVDAKTHATTERSGFVVEHEEKLARRSGAPKEHCRTVDGAEDCDPLLTDSEIAALDPRQGMDRDRIAALTLFHAAVGNWDWHLDVGPVEAHAERVWNHDVLLLPKDPTKPDGDLTMVPVAHDFDLASAVTGRVGVNAPTPASLAAQAKEYLKRTAGLTPEEVARAKDLFHAKKSALYAAVDASSADDAGRALSKAHLDAFFAAIE